MDDDEAAQPTVTGRRRSERVTMKPNALAISTMSERDVSGSEDTSASGLDVQDGVDSNTKPALFTAAIGEDVTVHFSYIAGVADMKNFSNYPQNRRTIIEV